MDGKSGAIILVLTLDIILAGWLYKARTAPTEANFLKRHPDPMVSSTYVGRGVTASFPDATITYAERCCRIAFKTKTEKQVYGIPGQEYSFGTEESLYILKPHFDCLEVRVLTAD